VIPVAEIQFYDVIVFVHVAAVVLGFGPTFGYPFFQAVVERGSPRSLPAMFRGMHAASTYLVTPAFLVVIAAGLYLVIFEDRYDFSPLFVQVGLAVVVILLALNFLFFLPHEKRAIELSERDVAAAETGDVQLSDEYLEVSKKLERVGTLAGLLVIVTVFFMVVKP
jgi:uncharacterized membrane protein